MVLVPCSVLRIASLAYTYYCGTQSHSLCQERKYFFYDGPEFITDKVRFAMNRDLFGCMIRFIATDDFRDESSHGNTHLLSKTTIEVIEDAKRTTLLHLSTLGDSIMNCFKVGSCSSL